MKGVLASPAEGAPPRASSLLVNVLAPGDSKPQFLSSTYKGRVQEELEPPVEILKVRHLSLRFRVASYIYSHSCFHYILNARPYPTCDDSFLVNSE